MSKHNLTKTDLIEVLESVDSLGYGNPEAKVFEEINVYFVSPVILDQMTNKQIQNKIEKYREQNNIEFERVWYGVSLFKGEYENLNNQNIDRNDFIWRLIEIFYEKVYFENYKYK